jgi:flavin reductase (DIM6/NTAB) family NADH-FMN oxidoreductase RutF
VKIQRRPATSLLPLPAVLVTVGDGKRANIITLAWVGVVCSTPPMVGIAVRPSRHSYGLVAAAREFVVNIPRAAHAEQVDLAGIISGREVDKFAACGFTAQPAAKVGAPLIAECPVNLECVVRHQLSLGSHDLFLGEIVATHYDEEMLDSRGRPIVSKLDPFAYVEGEYWSLKEKLGAYGFSRKAAKGSPAGQS